MKNFDFPYINDSPIDLSGREGAPRDLSGIHDGAACTCEMCLWANKQEREMLLHPKVGQTWLVTIRDGHTCKQTITRLSKTSIDLGDVGAAVTGREPTYHINDIRFLELIYPIADTDDAKCDDIDAVLMGLSPFAAAWASAPETQRRYTERDCAAYWFEQGQIAGMGTIKQDLAEMRQLMREKGLA